MSEKQSESEVKIRVRTQSGRCALRSDFRSDFCAEEEIRTPTPLRALPPQGSASAISPPPLVNINRTNVMF